MTEKHLLPGDENAQILYTVLGSNRMTEGSSDLNLLRCSVTSRLPHNQGVKENYLAINRKKISVLCTHEGRSQSLINSF